MHLLQGLILTAALISGSTAITTPKPSEACSLKARGPLLHELQDTAIKDFAQIFFVDRNPKKAFDKYVPGRYIEHNPNGLSGRENAISFLTGFLATPGLTVTNLTAYAGGGFGHMRFREGVKGEFDRVVSDRLKFEGTCFVEHWDVSQDVTGQETNPLAWF
ncbi:hypothetical protein D9611_012390 [Ephemerocybe angulata]|uniref:SnoaL-like domain-containing protein n=1 Tax=Ephemerocybe angulata TaxID=980116 RepID=A0A8H5FK16_9AGAR|nr:hypothetical protein D9611_012390 [Tulosesus angulatus]